MFCLLLTFFLIRQESSGLYVIDISSPKYKPVKIQFVPNDSSSEEVSKLVSRNLGVIGYFDVVKDGADVLVEIKKTKSGFQFTGRFSGEEYFNVELKSDDVKAICDSFSNYMIKKISGIETDIFGKKFFVLSNLDGKKEIYQTHFVSDRLEKIVSAKSFIPNFSVSPSGKKIAYTHYDGKNYRLYIADMSSKKIFSPVMKDGMFISPNFVSDDKIVLAWNSGAGANIYVLDMVAKSISRITSGNADVSARILPDGKRMVVVSGKGGLPQIYVKDINGNEEKLPLSGRYNSSPDVSPDGKRIVFTKLEGSRFNIYTYDFETRMEKPLVVDFGSSENPTWSRDGNFILFASNRDGDYDIYITDKFGNFIRKVFDTPKDEFQAIF